MVMGKKPQQPEPTRVEFPPHVPANRPESDSPGREFPELEALAPSHLPPARGQVYVSRRHEVDRYDDPDEDERYTFPGPPQDPFEVAETSEPHPVDGHRPDRVPDSGHHEHDPRAFDEIRRHQERDSRGYAEAVAPEEPEWDAAAASGPAGDGEEQAGPWERHPNDRWVVGDAGNQPAVRSRVPHRFRNPPPDTVIDGAEIGSISYRAASVRGISHQERGEPRQDAYAVHFTRDQAWLVGCISDGVSQGTRSHEAAAAICERISRALVDHLIASPPSADSGRWPEEIGSIRWADAVRSANAAVCELARPYLEKSAQKRGGPPAVEPGDPVPFAQARLIMSGTALAFVVATEPSPNGTFRAMLANVAGDSAAFVVQDGHWVPLTMIKNEGEAIFSSAVKALPADTEVHAKPFYLEPGQPLIMMTDGLGDPLGAARGAVSRFLGTRWRTPPDLLAFAQHLAFYRKTFTDDRTAVVVWPGPVRSAR
ncbi:protein phosphatase 2C domain-containing protein [Actinoplanes sp. NPDC049802]|uniref:protein phosphatase 2C domain-containing protein n=1 Tax=Actinoplanes sp. NPDC049802 TaxID=3154742 RepID=UPI0033D98C0C